MSRTIWTECGGAANCRTLALDAWRVVEGQFVNSTRKLVDSDAEQHVLEELIDGAKPPVPAGMAHLHYLLFTPFRHPPLRNGSRFGTALEQSLFYASRELNTALAEVAYYRLVFLSGTEAPLKRLQTEHTAFQVEVATERGIDLTAPPFLAHEAVLASRTDYATPQALGAQMRGAGVEAVCFTSARAAERGTNVALFSPSAFASPRPRTAMQSWICNTGPERVELKRRSHFETDHRVFPREDFLVDGVLPAPAL